MACARRPRGLVAENMTYPKFGTKSGKKVGTKVGKPVANFDFGQRFGTLYTKVGTHYTKVGTQAGQNTVGIPY